MLCSLCSGTGAPGAAAPSRSPTGTPSADEQQGAAQPAGLRTTAEVRTQAKSLPETTAPAHNTRG